MMTTAVGVRAQPSQPINDAGRKFAGERLVYDGKISKMKFTFSVAEITFTAADDPQNDGLLIKAEAVSKGTLLSLFRYSFLQQINSNIDLAGFKATRTDKHDVQKERVRDSEAVFDYAQRRVTFVETDPKDKMRAPRRIASGISDPSYDLVSVIYYIRLQELAIGKRFDLEVSDSGLVYKLPVVVTGREQQKSAIGKLQCWRIEPDIFGPGKLIERKGKMVIWVTDDAARVPVLAKINSEYGTISIKLKEYKKATQMEAVIQSAK
jgi:hypothetical protein